MGDLLVPFQLSCNCLAVVVGHENCEGEMGQSVRSGKVGGYHGEHMANETCLLRWREIGPRKDVQSWLTVRISNGFVRNENNG